MSGASVDLQKAAVAEEIRRYQEERLRFYYEGSDLCAPNPIQLEFHKSQAKIRGLFAGNQAGKTFAGTVEMLWVVAKVHPYRSNYIGLVYGRDCCDYLSTLRTTLIPTYNTLVPRDACVLPGRTFEGGVRRWPGIRGGSWKKAWSDDDKTLFLGDGSFIEFKCMRGDQRVLMSNGLWKPISEIVIGDLVLSHSGNTEVVNTFAYPSARLWKIKTLGGREIVATENHIHFLSDGQKKETSELEIGDILLIDREHRNFHSTGEPLEKWVLGWLGIMIGDGCLRREDAGFTAEENGRVMRDLPPLPPNTYINNVAPLDYRVSLIKPLVKNNPLVGILKSVGLWGKKSPEKFVPEIIFGQSPANKAYFLRHLWNCDGTINHPKRQSVLCTASRRLAYDIKYLLWSIGIPASMTEFISTCGNTGKHGIAYHVRVSGGSFDKFMAAISGDTNFVDMTTQSKGKIGMVMSIEQVDDAPVYCIEVNNSDHSFIVDGIITHNSYEQGREAFQGPVRHIIRMDEEPPESIYNENQLRQATVGRNLIFTLTPLNYSQWLFNDVYEKAVSNPQVAAFKMSTYDNPYSDPEEIKQIEQNVSDPIERAARLYGDFTFAAGRVYTEYGDHNVHVPFEIPSGWARSIIIDAHLEKPTYVLWAADSPAGKRFYYREMNIKGPVEQICKEIKALCGDEYIDLMLIDPSARQKASIYDKGPLIVEFRKHLPGLVEANNNVMLGIDATRRAFKNGTNGPMSYVFKGGIGHNIGCPILHFQLSNYSWKPPTVSGESRGKPEVVKKNDEGPDCVRYREMYGLRTRTQDNFKGFNVGVYAN